MILLYFIMFITPIYNKQSTCCFELVKIYSTTISAWCIGMMSIQVVIYRQQFAAYYCSLMFDFLNKLSHQHPNKQEPQHRRVDDSHLVNDSSEFQQHSSHEEPAYDRRNGNKGQKQKQKQVTASRATIVPKRQLSLSAQLQSGQSAELDAQVLLILQRIRDESDKRLSEAELELVLEQKAKVERKVYLREMSHSNQQYLQEILIQSSSPNKLIRYGLAQVADNVVEGICTDIAYTDKYEITKKASINKDELLLLEKSIKQIKHNEGSIRDKVGELKLQLRNESQKINDHSLEIISKQSYSVHHPKTKEVEHFLKNIQSERMQQRMRYELKLEKEKQKKARESYMMEVAKEKALSERHERLVEVFQIKRKVKQEEIQMSAKKNQQFQQWIKAYKNKTPLFKQKEKEFFENVVLKQKQQQYEKMLRRKQDFLPMEFDDIEEHEQRYMDYKKDNLIRHSAEVKMQKQAQKRRQQKIDNLYKGQFRYHVLEQMVAKKETKDPKQQKIQKKLRQMAYSQNVKETCKPRVDELKRLEMQNLLNSSKKKRKYREPKRVQSDFVQSSYNRSYSQEKQWEEKDSKKQGERNRRYLKQYLMDKFEKGQIKKKQEERPMTIQPKPQYLQELKKQRQESGFQRSETIDQQIESIKRKKNFGGLLAMVDHHDSKAQRLEQKFKHAAHKPKEEAELEDNYLFSIKAKLELLKNFD